MFSLAVLLLLARTGFSQNTNATCLPEWKWSFNSINQSPCVVASWLAGACIDDVFNIAALEPDLHYVGPANKLLSTPCVCSSVTYALVSACGMCQGQSTTQQWSSWTTNCTDGDIKKDGYGHAVPEGTLIPQWAFIDIPAYNMLDVNAARAIANQSRPDIGPNGAVEKKKKSAPIGAIVGGVLGGLLVLGIVIACIVWFCLRRKRARADGLNKPVYDPDMTKQPGFLSAQPTGNAYSPGSPTQNYAPKQTYDPPPPVAGGMFTAQPNMTSNGYATGVPTSPTTPSGVAPVRSSVVYSQPQQPHSAVPDASGGFPIPYAPIGQGGHGGSPGEAPPAHPASFYNVAAASQYGVPQSSNPYQQPAVQQHAGPYARHPEV